MVFKSFYDVFFEGVQIESLGKQVMRLTCRTGQGLIVLESFYDVIFGRVQIEVLYSWKIFFERY